MERFSKDEGKIQAKFLPSSLSASGTLIILIKRGKSDKDLQNLRQEIEILRSLKHENIILLLDAFETSHEFCVVTECAQGELFEILEDDRNLPEAEVRKIAM